MTDAALQRAEQPTLQERGDRVHARHRLVRGIGADANHAHPVLVAGRLEPGVAAPAVGVDRRPRHDGSLNEGQQAVG